MLTFGVNLNNVNEETVLTVEDSRHWFVAQVDEGERCWLFDFDHDLQGDGWVSSVDVQGGKIFLRVDTGSIEEMEAQS